VFDYGMNCLGIVQRDFSTSNIAAVSSGVTHMSK
jgi:hypothetical protein